MYCKKCNSSFHEGNDSIILCEHHEGFVHLGCCMDTCSQDKMPCKHSKKLYEQITFIPE